MKKIEILKISFIAIIISTGFSSQGIAQKGEEELELKEKVWEMQATCVAESYGSDNKEVNRLIAVYVNIRKEINEKNRALDRKSNPDDYKEKSLLNENEGKKEIKKVINKILNPNQVEEVCLLLGSFNSRWDSYQKLLLEMNLGKEELTSSSLALTEYMKLYLKARKIASESGERFSGRTASDLKSNLDKSLSEFLNPVQMSLWLTETQRKAKRN